MPHVWPLKKKRRKKGRVELSHQTTESQSNLWEVLEWTWAGGVVSCKVKEPALDPQPCLVTTGGQPWEEHDLSQGNSLAPKHRPEWMSAWCCLQMAALQLGRDPSWIITWGPGNASPFGPHLMYIFCWQFLWWDEGKMKTEYFSMYLWKSDKLKSLQFSKMLFYISEFLKCLQFLEFSKCPTNCVPNLSWCTSYWCAASMWSGVRTRSSCKTFDCCSWKKRCAGRGGARRLPGMRKKA